MNYDDFKKGIEVTYKRDGTFGFKGIQLSINESVQLADIIGEIVTGIQFLTSINIPAKMCEDEQELIKAIDKRLHNLEQRQVPFEKDS